MTVHAIAFDFGNVVGFFDYTRTTNRLASQTDLSADEMYRRVYSSDLEFAYDSGKITTGDFLGRIRLLCELRCPEEEIASAWADIFRTNEEVISLLPFLKERYRLILASNTNELHSRQFTQQFKAALANFDAMVFSHAVGVRNPDPGFFEQCRKLAGFPAEECLFIDDLPVNVAGARNCGWQGIVYRGAADLRKELERLGIVLPSPG
jgi:putative hydrolase of the HAD superfamily